MPNNNLRLEIKTVLLSNSTENIQLVVCDTMEESCFEVLRHFFPSSFLIHFPLFQNFRQRGEIGTVYQICMFFLFFFHPYHNLNINYTKIESLVKDIDISKCKTLYQTHTHAPMNQKES